MDSATNTATWAYSASIGFVPWNFLFWPFQIAVFVIIIVVMTAAFGVEAGKAVFWSYLLQAAITTVAVKFATDKIVNLYNPRGLFKS